MSKPEKHVQLYTDGACSGNPGPGGYGAILVYREHRREISGGYRDTTNNRMEIMAVLQGLALLKEPCQVTVYSDSKYVCDAMTQGWVKRWQANGWMRNRKDPALNVDLWEEMLGFCRIHELRFEWVKGHAGHPENECCDKLATEALKGENLPADEGRDR